MYAGEFIAIFDADFVPPVDFLKTTLRHFTPDVAVVQTRWGHLNRRFSPLTIAQSPVIDGHFGVEQAARARSGDLLATTGINVEEVVRGLHPPEEAAGEELFAGLVVLSIGLAEGRQAGSWRREFAKRGTTLSQADCLIAAAAQSAGAHLATGSPDDFPMAELVVEHWPVG